MAHTFIVTVEDDDQAELFIRAFTNRPAHGEATTNLIAYNADGEGSVVFRTRLAGWTRHDDCGSALLAAQETVQ